MTFIAKMFVAIIMLLLAGPLTGNPIFTMAAGVLGLILAEWMRSALGQWFSFFVAVYTVNILIPILGALRIYLWV